MGGNRLIQGYKGYKRYREKLTIAALMLVFWCCLLGGCTKTFQIQSPIGKGIYRANLLYRSARYQECLTELKNLLAIDPDDPHIHYNLGLTYAQLNQYNQARDEYLKALKQKENIPQIHQGLGDLYRQQHLYAKAIIEYQRALTLLPASVETRMRLASAYEGLGKMDMAIKEYQSALRLKTSPGMYLDMGNIYYKLKQYNDAISSYQKALLLAPDMVKIYNNLGLSLEKKGETQKAVAFYQKAIQKNSHYYFSYINLGALYRSTGKYELAREYYQKALLIEPDCPEAFLNLGILYDLYLSSPEEAIKNYRHYCQAGGPRSSEVRKWIETLQLRK
jgi:tetratricopeptide (TPR) repeat protein